MELWKAGLDLYMDIFFCFDFSREKKSDTGSGISLIGDSRIPSQVQLVIRPS